MTIETDFLNCAAEKLAQLCERIETCLAKLTPDQIKYVGISHYHADHTSQLPSLPKATLLIGKGDWDAVNAPKPAEGVNAAAFTHWISGGGKAEPVALDKDVFGDGTVIMLNTPGHTPGHHSLLVNLKEKGAVILTGDLAHFHENYDASGVPSFNTDRAASLASLDRVKKLAANLKEAGYSVSYTKKGELRLDSVSLEVEREFSKRSVQIWVPPASRTGQRLMVSPPTQKNGAAV